MKNKLTLTMALAGAFALASVSANANTISVGSITTAPDGTGGLLWTYPIIFANSTVSSTAPPGGTAFNINDFGPLKLTTPGFPLGYTFTPVSAAAVALTYTVTTPNTGPNFGLPGFNPNSPIINDFVVTFTGGPYNMTQPDVTFNLVINTPLALVGGLANFFSQDLVQSGDLAGTPNAVQQNVRTPLGTPTTLPDGGTTVMLLGFALAGLAGLRRKLTV